MEWLNTLRADAVRQETTVSQVSHISDSPVIVGTPNAGVGSGSETPASEDGDWTKVPASPPATPVEENDAGYRNWAAEEAVMPHVADNQMRKTRVGNLRSPSLHDEEQPGDTSYATKTSALGQEMDQTERRAANRGEDIQRTSSLDTALLENKLADLVRNQLSSLSEGSEEEGKEIDPIHKLVPERGAQHREHEESQHPPQSKANDHIRLCNMLKVGALVGLGSVVAMKLCSGK